MNPNHDIGSIRLDDSTTINAAKKKKTTKPTNTKTTKTNDNDVIDLDILMNDNNINKNNNSNNSDISDQERGLYYKQMQFQLDQEKAKFEQHVLFENQRLELRMEKCDLDMKSKLDKFDNERRDFEIEKKLFFAKWEQYSNQMFHQSALSPIFGMVPQYHSNTIDNNSDNDKGKGSVHTITASLPGTFHTTTSLPPSVSPSFDSLAPSLSPDAPSLSFTSPTTIRTTVLPQLTPTEQRPSQMMLDTVLKRYHIMIESLHQTVKKQEDELDYAAKMNKHFIKMVKREKKRQVEDHHVTESANLYRQLVEKNALIDQLEGEIAILKRNNTTSNNNDKNNNNNNNNNVQNQFHHQQQQQQRPQQQQQQRPQQQQQEQQRPIQHTTSKPPHTLQQNPMVRELHSAYRANIETHSDVRYNNEQWVFLTLENLKKRIAVKVRTDEPLIDSLWHNGKSALFNILREDWECGNIPTNVYSSNNSSHDDNDDNNNNVYLAVASDDVLDGEWVQIHGRGIESLPVPMTKDITPQLLFQHTTEWSEAKTFDNDRCADGSHCKKREGMTCLYRCWAQRRTNDDNDDKSNRMLNYDGDIGYMHCRRAHTALNATDQVHYHLRMIWR